MAYRQALWRNADSTGDTGQLSVYCAEQETYGATWRNFRRNSAQLLAQLGLPVVKLRGSGADDSGRLD
jgi:hypothetical protein